MKLTAQEEYGLRCLLQVAKLSKGGSVTIHEISQAEGLSVPNVAKLMRLLRLRGVVRSVRGQSGGYALATSANKTTLAEILELLGGPLYGSVFCVNHSGEQEVCPHSPDCSIRPVWRKVQETLTEVFEQITLQDLLCHENEMSHRVSITLGVLSKKTDAPQLSVGTSAS